MQTTRLLPLLCALAAIAVPPAVLAAQPATAKPPTQTQVQPALDALQQLLSAYATGNHMQIELMVEPTMLGYSRVVDPVRDATLAQKQIRIHLSDTRTQVSEDVVIVQTRWEKNFLSGRQAGRRSGACTFVMRPDAAGWKLSALHGDNPFAAE